MTAETYNKFIRLSMFSRYSIQSTPKEGIHFCRGLKTDRGQMASRGCATHSIAFVQTGLSLILKFKLMATYQQKPLQKPLLKNCKITKFPTQSRTPLVNDDQESGLGQLIHGCHLLAPVGTAKTLLNIAEMCHSYQTTHLKAR